MGLEKDIQGLENHLDVAGPPSQEDVIRCLAAILSAAHLGACFKRSLRAVETGTVPELSQPWPLPVERLVGLVRLDAGPLSDWLSECSDAGIAYALHDPLRCKTWSPGAGGPLPGACARVRAKYIVEFLAGHEDAEIIKMVQTVRAENRRTKN